MTKARELADLAGSSGGGIDVEAERLNQVIQSIPGAEGFDWSAGMAFDVVDAVPADIDGKVGDVVFIPGGPGESPAVGGGKILQVVMGDLLSSDKIRTNEDTFEDADVSVSITPTQSASKIILMWSFAFQSKRDSTTNGAKFQIVDNGGNVVEGSFNGDNRVSAVGSATTQMRHNAYITLIGTAAVASKNEVTFKGQFACHSNANNSVTTIQGVSSPTRIIAFEVSA